MSFPDSFATARLVAERLRPEHLDEIRRMHQNADHMALLGGLRDEEKTAAYMAYNLEHWEQYGFGMWMWRDALTAAVAGRGMLRHLSIDGIDEIEVGYGLYPAYWGRGLATEIAGACLERARTALGVPSVVAVTVPHHARSRRVMEKVGMTHERDITYAGTVHALYRIQFSAADTGPTS